MDRYVDPPSYIERGKRKIQKGIDAGRRRDRRIESERTGGKEKKRERQEKKGEE